MIFLTVGSLFSFDRFVKAIDEAVGEGLILDEVFSQIGPDAYKPRNMDYVEFLDKEAFDKRINNATCLLSHAGMGSITMALEHQKPLLVMPRMKKYKEHVNDHQVGTAKKFEQLGHVLVAYEAADLPEKMKQLKSFVPRKREAQPQAVAKRIKCFIDKIAGV